MAFGKRRTHPEEQPAPPAEPAVQSDYLPPPPSAGTRAALMPGGFGHVPGQRIEPDLVFQNSVRLVRDYVEYGGGVEACPSEIKAAAEIVASYGAYSLVGNAATTFIRTLIHYKRITVKKSWNGKPLKVYLS